MQHGGIQTIQGGFIPEWQPLPVRIRGQIDRGVAQLSLHVGERFALLQHETQSAVLHGVQSRPCRNQPAAIVCLVFKILTQIPHSTSRLIKS
jgi:hypothetical protein